MSMHFFFVLQLNITDKKSNTTKIAYWTNTIITRTNYNYAGSGLFSRNGLR